MRLVTLTAFSLLSLFTRAEAAENFTVDHYLKLNDVSEISVSPEGDFIAYTISSRDLEKDEQRHAVWMVPADGGEAMRMSAVESDSYSAAFSPDGKYLAMLSDRKDDTTQVWLLDRRGGDAQQLTEYKQGVDSFAWSPDGKRMLLVVEDATPADLDEEELPNPRPWVIDRLQFKQDYVGYLDRYRTHIHVIDVTSRAARQITHGDYEDEEPAWSPDGKRIVFVSNRTDEPDRNRNTDLWIVDVDGKDGNLLRLTENETADASPTWSPDGGTIAFTSTDPGVLPIYAIPQLTVIDVASRESRLIDALAEVQVFQSRFSPDGKSLLAINEYHGEQNLLQIELASGAIRSLAEGEDIVHEFDLASDGRVAALVSRPQLPAEVFTLANGTLTQRTFSNKAMLDELQLAEVSKFAYASSDGAAMEAFVVYPPGYRKGRRYPGLLRIHGGPQAQYDYSFSAEAQIMASEGYVVIMPNPRGSTGYGQAFAAAIYRDWGGIDYEDVIASMDHAVAEGWVDAGRMGVFGWSYGGMMTNHVITKTDRFKAAITGASAALYMSNYGHDQYQRWWEEELGLPWLEENRENWDRLSPFYRLQNVRTPTLIVGGEDDWNVPILNSEQLFIALKRQDVPTELIVYPDQGHGISVPSYEKHLYERYISWMARWVKGQPQAVGRR